MADGYVLQDIYLFKGLSADQLASVGEIAKINIYKPTDEIFGQGSKATAAYFIKHGSVRITQSTKDGDRVEVATLGTGSHFGEMSFLDSEARSATATASERTELIEIPFQSLKDLFQAKPLIAVHFYRALATFLAGRLRITTNDLNFARAKNLSHF
jgi:CRP/FNR family transcriptional regulator